METNTDPKLVSPCALNLCSHIVQFYDGNVDPALARDVLGGLLTQLKAKFNVIHAYGKMVKVGS